MRVRMLAMTIFRSLAGRKQPFVTVLGKGADQPNSAATQNLPAPAANWPATSSAISSYLDRSCRRCFCPRI